MIDNQDLGTFALYYALVVCLIGTAISVVAGKCIFSTHHG